MLELTQNNCVICLENEKPLNPLNNKASYFNCSCSIYFHKDCWENFINNQNKCPYCRIIAPAPVPAPVPALMSIIRKYNIFLLLTQILISSSCVLNTIGLVELKSSDNYITEIIIITSAIYLDFLFIFILDCNTHLFLYDVIRKLFIGFNLYKIIIIIFSIIVICLGQLNNNQHILYGTISYISSYCLVTILAVITYLTIN